MSWTPEPAIAWRRGGESSFCGLVVRTEGRKGNRGCCSGIELLEEAEEKGSLTLDLESEGSNMLGTWREKYEPGEGRIWKSTGRSVSVHVAGTLAALAASLMNLRSDEPVEFICSHGALSI